MVETGLIFSKQPLASLNSSIGDVQQERKLHLATKILLWWCYSLQTLVKSSGLLMYIKFYTSPKVKGELQEVEDGFLFGTYPMWKQENLLDAKLLLKNIHWNKLEIPVPITFQYIGISRNFLSQ